MCWFKLPRKKHTEILLLIPENQIFSSFKEFLSFEIICSSIMVLHLTATKRFFYLLWKQMISMNQEYTSVLIYTYLFLFVKYMHYLSLDSDVFWKTPTVLERKEPNTGCQEVVTDKYKDTHLHTHTHAHKHTWNQNHV